MSELFQPTQASGQPSLLRHAGLYALFNALAALFPLLVTPILTRLVTPANYGVYGLVLTAVVVAMPLIGAGVETAVGRRFIDRTEIDYARYVTTALAVTAMFAIAVLGVAALLQAPLAGVFPLPPLWYCAWIASAWSQVVLGIVLSLLQMAQRPAEYGLWRVGRAGAIQLLTVAVAVTGFRDWQALVLAMTVANLALCLQCFLWLRREGLLAGIAVISRADAKQALGYGAPLIPHMLVSAAVVAAGPFFLNALANIDAVGIYAVGAQLGQGMFLIATSINRAWAPWFYESLKAGMPRGVLWRAGLRWGGGLIVAGAAVAVAGALLIPWFVGPAYSAAVPVFAWSVAAWTLHGLWGLASATLYYHGRTGWISAVSVVTLAVNLALNPVLIAAHGLAGAAAAMCAAYGVTFLLGSAVSLLMGTRRARIGRETTRRL